MGTRGFFGGREARVSSDRCGTNYESGCGSLGQGHGWRGGSRNRPREGIESSLLGDRD